MVSQSRQGLVTSHNPSPASGWLRPQSLSLIRGEGGPAEHPHSPCHQSGLAVSRKGAPSSASHPDTDLQGARKPYRVLPGGPCPQSSRRAQPQKVDSGSDTERGPCSLQLRVWTAHRLPPAGSTPLPTPQLVLAKLTLLYYQPRQRTTGKTKVVSGTLQEATRPSLAHPGLGCHTVRKSGVRGTPNGGPTCSLESQPCQSPGRGAQPGPDNSEPLRSAARRLVAENGDARVRAAVGLWRPSGQGSGAPGWEVLSEK